MKRLRSYPRHHKILTKQSAAGIYVTALRHPNLFVAASLDEETKASIRQLSSTINGRIGASRVTIDNYLRTRSSRIAEVFASQLRDT